MLGSGLDASRFLQLRYSRLLLLQLLLRRPHMFLRLLQRLLRASAPAARLPRLLRLQ